MAGLTGMTGVSKVLAKMKASTVAKAVGVEKGLKDAGLFLQRESQKIVPVDTANLKGGAFTRKVSGSGFDADIVVGYVADYAVYVHEDLQAKHQSGQQAKYLEQPAREKKGELLRIIGGK